MRKARKLYESPNGDRWYLVRDHTGALFVRHEANVVSGGYVAHIEVGAFLASGKGPEHQELLRLIGSLLDEHAHCWSLSLRRTLSPECARRGETPRASDPHAFQTHQSESP